MFLVIPNIIRRSKDYGDNSSYPIDILTQNTLNSLIHFACLGESATVLSYLLQRCPKKLVNHRNSNKESPLHWAVKSSSTEL